jgi:hypothetical protein
VKRPNESDYTSHVAYTRALEEYCDMLEQPAQEPVAYRNDTAIGRLRDEPGDWMLIYGKPQHPHTVALYATPPAAPVQDGWILVPVTLTNDMTVSMADALEDPNNERSSWDLAENMWRAMLTVNPTPPAQPAQEPVALKGGATCKE